MIKKEIPFEIINEIEKFDTETVCIKIKFEKDDLHLINYYIPPDVEPNVEMLKCIDTNFKKYIICGDLNSKHETFGAQTSNANGEKLNEFIEKPELFY